MYRVKTTIPYRWLFLVILSQSALSMALICCFASQYVWMSFQFNTSRAGHQFFTEPAGWLYTSSVHGYGSEANGGRFNSGSLASNYTSAIDQLASLSELHPKLFSSNERYIQTMPGFVCYRSPTELIVGVRHWLALCLMIVPCMVVAVYCRYRIHATRTERSAADETE